MNAALTLLIVDDEAPARTRLRHLLGDIAAEFPHQCIGEADHPEAALQLFQDTQPDIILLDIHMPGMNGIEFARHVLAAAQQQDGGKEPCIIFITAFDDYALQAFEVHAMDYLVKPVRAARLLESLRRAAQWRQQLLSATTISQHAVLQQLAPVRAHLSIQERGRLVLIPLRDVIYLKAELKYITVRTREREYLIEESLVSLEQEFQQQFIRIHRNALIARHAIMGFERVSQSALEGEEATPTAGEPHWEVVLKDIPERLPVSRRQWGQVKALVQHK